MATVLLAAFVVRVIGVGSALPYVHNPDEQRNIAMAHRMVVEHDPNPHFFNYPSLMLELQAAVHAGYVIAGVALGRFDGAADVAMPRMQTLGNGVTDDSTVFALARLVTVMAGVALVGAGMWLAWLATHRRDAALVAGLLLAFHPTLVRHARLATPDTLAGLTVTAALALAIIAARRRGVVAYAIAGCAIGLAASSKYNAAVVAIGLVVAHICAHGRASLRSPWLVGLAGITALASFVATTPFALLDWRDFLDDATREARHYRTGHVGAEGASLATNARWLWEATGPALVFAVFAAWHKGRRRLLAVPLVFAVTYFALLSAQRVRFERNLVPLLPALLVLVAVGAVAVGSRIRARPVHLGLGLVALAAWPALLAARGTASTLSNDRAEAGEWIARNIRAGAEVMVENYSPYVDPDRFSVIPVDAALLRRDVIQAEQPTAVVVTDASSGRWLRDPARRDDAAATQSWLRATACDRMTARGGIEVFQLECRSG